MTVTNFSAIDATGVVLIDTLPPGFDPTIYICSPGDPATLSQNVVTCNIGDLLAGQKATLTLGGTIAAAAAGVLVNTAEIIADGVNPLPQHTDVEETAVQYPDLAVEISDWSDPVQVGYYLIYTVTATNLSTFPAQDVVVTDTLPPDTELISCAASQGTCTPGTGIVTANFGSLNGASSAQMTIVVKVLTEGSIVNTAEITNALGTDHDPVDNVDSEETEITVWRKEDLGHFGGNPWRQNSLVTDPSGNLWVEFIFDNGYMDDGHLKVADNTHGDWRITSFPGVVDDAALTVDEKGVVHMVYSETDNYYSRFNLKYIRNTGGVWSQPQLVFHDERSCRFDSLNIEVDSFGTIHIACIGCVYVNSDRYLWYFKSFIDGDDLKFTEHWQSAIWSVSLAVEDRLDAAGFAHFSYYGTGLLNDGSWGFGIGYTTQKDPQRSEIVDPGWGCVQCEMKIATDTALDSQHRPHIVYVSEEDNDGYEHYWHAVKNGDIWERTRLANGYDYSGGCAVDLDVNDGVHTVVYVLSESGGEVAYVAKRGDTWETEIIYSRESGSVRSPNILVDDSQNVHILFQDDDHHMQIRSSRLAGDTDLDNISDMEEMGPSGDDPTWDGNNDGTPDFQQPHVASLEAWNDSGYVTLAAPDHLILADVQAIDNPSPLDTPVDQNFALGWFSFKVLGLSPGEAVPVQLHLPQGSVALSYYKYGPTQSNPQNHWYAFAYDDITETGAVISGNVITLNLIDGKRGDNSLLADGVIVEPGGPVLAMPLDADEDGVDNSEDNCPAVANPDQEDGDGDGTGDACDNCPDDPGKIEPGICGCGSPDLDTDSDGLMNCEDTDDDGDAIPDIEDAFPEDPGEWNDADEDAIGDNADPDDDNDGVSDVVESQGPNNGDSNQDGIADSLQNHVSCLKLNNNLGYAVIEAPDTTFISNCQIADNPSPDNSPTGVDFTYGLYDFTISGIQPGGSVTITITLPENVVPKTYYKYGKTPAIQTDHWYEFLYNGEIGAEFNNNVITLHFEDADMGDDILMPDAMVVDLGGPGFAAVNNSSSDQDGGSGGGGGCFIDLLK